MPSTTSRLNTCPVELQPATVKSSLEPEIEKYETALLMLLGFAGFSAFVGFLYNILRRRVFRDWHSLDVVFDAGGHVSVSLTAVTVTSQLLWPADFLQSPTLGSKVGIGGSLWYTMAVVLSMLVFPVLNVHLKTRAPGAKTYPQIAYARFGKPTHIMFCIIALCANIVIVANLILAGKAAIEVVTKNTSNEFITLVLAVLFGSYCLIGGLGTTFYISYFNTSIIFIVTSTFILKLGHFAMPAVKNVTSTDAMYDAMSCLKGPDGNYGNSFLTFRTESGLIFGVVMLFMTIAILICDQATWQSRIAAKPTEGILGFFIAAFLWFAFPTSISFVMSMTYKTMSFKNGTNLLTDEEIDEGFITPFVIQELLGREGSFLLLTMLSMTLMSTGSGEVMSLSSILVYDVYKIYINPFRKDICPISCIICGKPKVSLNSDSEKEVCDCPSSTGCHACADDIQLKLSGKLSADHRYSCAVHGKYRHYEDILLRYKSWCMVCIVACIVPFGLIVIESGMNLNWAYMAAQVFLAPFLTPLFLTIAWTGAQGPALIAGGIFGLVAAFIGMISYASTYEGGLANFYTNTAQDWSLLTGLVAGFFTSTVVCIVVSLYLKSRNRQEPTTIHRSLGDNLALKPTCVLNGEKGSEPPNRHAAGNTWKSVNYEWIKTMCIDNPLNPYRNLYKDQLDEINAGQLVTTEHMQEIFKNARKLSLLGAAVSFLVFFVIIPAVALSQSLLSRTELGTWISVCQYWCLAITVLVVLVPPIQESFQIWRRMKMNKLERPTDDENEQGKHVYSTSF